jgi:hypothetical protein
MAQDIRDLFGKEDSGTSEEKLNKLEEKLDPFFENNPYSNIGVHEGVPSILCPWNDDSIAINIPEKFEDELIEYLNSVKLPQRFSGIYHIEEQTMEFIFVPIDEENELFEQEFEINFDGESYTCSLKEASSQLKLINAMYSLTERDTRTNFRDLDSLNYYIKALANKVMKEQIDEEEQEYKELVPASFYIEGLSASFFSGPI